MPKDRSEIYEFGDFRLNVSEHRLERLTGPVDNYLPEKAFLTLVALLRNSGSLVTKEELISAVWPDTIVEENNLGKAIHAIRGALGDKGSDQRYIETVPKHGYRFVADVRRIGISLSYSNASTDARSEPLRSPAYDLYLRGKVRAGSENRKDIEAAIKILEAAAAIDPNLAGAYAQLARAYNTMAFKFSSAEQAKMNHETAEVVLLKALEIDPDLSDAHFVRGLLLWTRRQGFPHELAIRSYKRALELEPNYDETHHQLSMIYGHVGLIEEAQKAVQRALDLNPNNTMARFRSGVWLAYRGEFEEALAVFNGIPRDLSPLLVDRCAADALIQLGRYSEAERIVDGYLSNFPQDEGGSFTSVRALLLAKAGQVVAAEKAIEAAATIGAEFGHFHHTAHNIASAFAAMDRPDEAINWLENAAGSGFPNFTYFAIDPNLNPLRSHPRFIRFQDKLERQWKRLKEIASE